MLASLYDHDEANEGNAQDGSVSMQHVKTRGERVIRAFDDLYCKEKLFDACLSPESIHDKKEENGASKTKAKCIASQIREIFLKTGYMLHKNNRLLAPPFSSGCFSDVQFLRGHYPWELDHIKISGLGLYKKRPMPLTDNDTFSVQKQFCLHEQPLLQWWQKQSRNLQWQETAPVQPQFFNLHGQIGEKYWTSECSHLKNTITLFRTVLDCASNEYGLIRTLNGRFETCKLSRAIYNVYYPSPIRPRFDTMAIALALMNDQGIPYYAKIKKGTEFSWVHIDWRLPCREQDFFELYSWPKDAANAPWCRMFSNDLLPLIKHMLVNLGFVIQEV